MRKLNSLFALTLMVLSGSLALSAEAAARPGKAHAVGSGLAYPTLGHSLFVNPAAIVDSPKVSLQGAYLIDPEAAHASLISGGSVAGFGAGFRQTGTGSTEELGFAGRLNIMTLGVTLRTFEFEGLTGDVAATFNLGGARVSVIGRDFAEGFERLDVGLGFMNGPFTFGFDVKKPLAEGNDSWFFDTGLAISNGSISAGVGYTFTYLDDFQGGNVHAGLSIDVTKSIAIEAFHRPSEQEWSAGEWVVGARVQL